jgi:hypothetical protein
MSRAVLFFLALPAGIGLAVAAHVSGWTQDIILIELIWIAALLGRTVDLLERRP